MSRPDRSLGDRVLASPTVQTLVAFLVVFVSMRLLVPFWDGFLHLFVLSSPILAKPWTIVTSVYSHASLGHLLANSVMLLFVGIPLERATRSWAYHLFFVLTGAIAGLSQIWAVGALSFATDVLNVLIGWLVTVPTVEANVGVLGASGAVFAMLGYHLTGNRLSSGLLEAVPVPDWVQLAGMVVVAIAITLWTASPGVALFAHFVGLMLGLIAGRINLLPGAKVRSEPA